MGTITDLVAQLESAGSPFRMTFLVVISGTRTDFIASSSEDKLDLLKAAIAQGGQAVGLIGIMVEDTSEGRNVSFHSRPLKECASQLTAVAYLDSLAGTVRSLFKIFIASGLVKLNVGDLETKSGWAN